MKVILTFYIALSVYISVSAESAKKEDPVPSECEICRLLWKEIHRRLDAPHEEVKLGSRLSVENTYKAKKYEESELRIIEILEESCKIMDSLKQKKASEVEGYKPDSGVDPDQLVWSYKPPALSSSHDNSIMGEKVVRLQASKPARIMCDSIVENYEEELEALLRAAPKSKLSNLQRQQRFCRKIAKICKAPKFKKVKMSEAQKVKKRTDKEHGIENDVEIAMDGDEGEKIVTARPEVVTESRREL